MKIPTASNDNSHNLNFIQMKWNHNEVNHKIYNI